jgi:hypothetical protein
MRHFQDQGFLRDSIAATTASLTIVALADSYFYNLIWGAHGQISLSDTRQLCDSPKF